MVRRLRCQASKTSAIRSRQTPAHLFLHPQTVCKDWCAALATRPSRVPCLQLGGRVALRMSSFGDYLGDGTLEARRQRVRHQALWVARGRVGARRLSLCVDGQHDEAATAALQGALSFLLSQVGLGGRAGGRCAGGTTCKTLFAGRVDLFPAWARAVTCPCLSLSRSPLTPSRQHLHLSLCCRSTPKGALLLPFCPTLELQGLEELEVMLSDPDGLRPYLAALAARPCPPMLRLEVLCQRDHPPLNFQLLPRGPRLGGVREMLVSALYGARVELAAPAPSLRALVVQHDWGDGWPPHVSIGGGGAAFPQLTRLEVCALRLELSCDAMPALERLSVSAWVPVRLAGLGACTRLAALELRGGLEPAQQSEVAAAEGGGGGSDSEEEEGGDGEEEPPVPEEEGAAGGPASADPNAAWHACLAGALLEAPASLRSLGALLWRAPAPGSALWSAVAGVTQLTRLRLRLSPQGRLQLHGPSLDCQMLAGMRQLRELQVTAGGLERTAALGALPLQVLTLEVPSLAQLPPLLELAHLRLRSPGLGALQESDLRALARLPQLARLGFACGFSRTLSISVPAPLSEQEQRALPAVRAALPAQCEIYFSPSL